MSLVQSALGGHGSQSFTTAGGTLGTITVSLPQATTAGNLLVLQCTHHQTLSTGTGLMASSFNNPTGIAGAWTTNGTSTFLLNGGNGPSGQKVACQLFFRTNCPSVSGGTVISIAVGVNSGSATGSESYEFAFYEFSGITSTLSGNNALDGNAQNNNTTGLPSTANLNTTKTDLIIVTAVGDTTTLTPAAAYTGGITLSNVSAISQLQYQLNVAPGSISTAWGAGSQTNCGCQAMAFQAPAGGGGFSGTSVNYGYLFG